MGYRTVTKDKAHQIDTLNGNTMYDHLAAIVVFGRFHLLPYL